MGFPGGTAVKNPPANAGEPVMIPGSGRSAGEGDSNSRPYSRLGNPVDRGASQATVHGVTKSRTRPSDVPSEAFLGDSELKILGASRI